MTSPAVFQICRLPFSCGCTHHLRLLLVYGSSRPLRPPRLPSLSPNGQNVFDFVDEEQGRAGMAAPSRYSTAHENSAHVAGVRYATRRTVTPFSLAERLLVQRRASRLEPLPLEIRSPSFFLPGVQQLPDHKAAWYDILLHANRIEIVEAWASQLIKGAVIVTDGDGSPYVLAHSA